MAPFPPSCFSAFCWLDCGCIISSPSTPRYWFESYAFHFCLLEVTLTFVSGVIDLRQSQSGVSPFLLGQLRS